MSSCETHSLDASTRVVDVEDLVWKAVTDTEHSLTQLSTEALSSRWNCELITSPGSPRLLVHVDGTVNQMVHMDSGLTSRSGPWLELGNSLTVLHVQYIDILTITI